MESGGERGITLLAKDIEATGDHAVVDRDHCAVVLPAATYRWQDRLLYFPKRVPLASLAIGWLQPGPSAPQKLRRFVAEPGGHVRGTVVVFHGNAGHAGHRADFAHALAPLGWCVVLAEQTQLGWGHAADAATSSAAA